MGYIYSGLILAITNPVQVPRGDNHDEDALVTGFFPAGIDDTEWGDL